jgi:hypothetical protein
MTQRKRFELAFKEFTVSIMPMAGKTADYDEWKDIQELVAALGQTTEDILSKGLSEDEVVLEVAQECGALIGRFSRRTAVVDDLRDLFIKIFQKHVDNPGRFEGNVKIGIAGGMR